MSVPAAFRALRRPLVTLCAVLLFANVWIPAFSVGVLSPGLICHGAGPVTPDAGGKTTGPRFQSCCFSAVVALMPEAVPTLTVRAAPGTQQPSRLVAAVTGPAAPHAFRIRAPPIS
ncbi:hypothetical protein DLJ53_19320 [Acuticoccus sediminis]|uniref:DUF2946 domain-containing protein n=1 Tax=Acuticoccus sediminis TaxID=2184697 RepID=A0A8B2NRZ7_9HYPH|nr:DUF2946 family protein [Acuticoccus sediminis]RAH99893.1 hypothetical protein DLJ53_19320 [Acuticoccus sediminis]